ncbi:hypothetical protein LguiB_006581 [Lonicera macranthoides]
MLALVGKDSAMVVSALRVVSAPAIESSLKLYEEVVRLGFKVFLLIECSEKQRNVIVENLIKVGFHDWDKAHIKGTIRELTEQVVSHLQMVDSRRKWIGLSAFSGKE